MGQPDHSANELVAELLEQWRMNQEQVGAKVTLVPIEANHGMDPDWFVSITTALLEADIRLFSNCLVEIVYARFNPSQSAPVTLGLRAGSLGDLRAILQQIETLSRVPGWTPNWTE